MVGIQQGTYLSRSGLQMLIQQGELGPSKHKEAATKLDHPFQTSANLPLVLTFATLESAGNQTGTSALRGRKLRRLKELAERAEPIDEEM